MSLKPITVLRRARKLIENPKSWIKGAFIGKRKGVQCYCGLGALATAAGVRVLNGNTLEKSPNGSLPREYYKAHALLRDAAGTFWFPDFNDSAKHADILKVFDKAIAAAKAG